MYSHVMVGSNALDTSKRFYDAVLGTLGIDAGVASGDRFLYRSPTGIFAITKPLNGQPATAANGGTIAFACPSVEQLYAWHEAGVANGGTSCEDPPGLRVNANGKYYLLCGALAELERPRAPAPHSELNRTIWEKRSNG
jgi:catechol 2,3-dioxygenase-like lactoylglutathione lyase family enzyme